MIGVKASIPIGTQIGHRECTAVQLLGIELALPCSIDQLVRPGGELAEGEAGTSRITGTTRPASVSTARPMWMLLA